MVPYFILERNLKDVPNYPQLLQGLIFDTITNTDVAHWHNWSDNGKFPCALFMVLTYFSLQCDQVQSKQNMTSVLSNISNRSETKKSSANILNHGTTDYIVEFHRYLVFSPVCPGSFSFWRGKDFSMEKKYLLLIL